MKNIIYGVLIAIIVGLIIYAIVLNTQLSKKNSIIYHKDSIIQLDSTKYMTLAQEYESLQQAVADLKQSNLNFWKMIEERNEEIKVLTNIKIGLEKKIFTHIDTTKIFQTINDTIRVPAGEDSVIIRENYLDFITVTGYTVLTPHKKSELEFNALPIEIDFVLTEDDNGIYSAYIDLKNPKLSLLDFKTKVYMRPQEESFWSNISGMFGAFFTPDNGFLLAGLSYKHTGYGLIYQRRWNDFDKHIFGGGFYIKF